MPGVIAVNPKYQFSNSIGFPLVNGTLTVTLTGTSTPTNTWQDSALTVLNTNPITLDSRGECVLWLDSAVTYRFVLKNSLGVTQWTVDNIKGSDSYAYTLASLLAASSGSSLVGYIATGAGAVATTVQQVLRTALTLEQFGAVGDGVADDAAAFVLAATAINALGGGTLVLYPGKTYYINTATSAAISLALINTKGFMLEGNGATIKTGTTNATKRIFNFSGCSNSSIKNVNLTSQYTTLDSANGIIWSDIKGGSKNTAFENVVVTYGLYGINSTGTGETLRVRNISAINCQFTGVYYPQRFETNGDDYFARGIVTRNCGRSYFPVNVINHDVWMDSQQGGPFSDVLLKCYTSTDAGTYYMVATYPNLENINLHYKTSGRFAGSGDCSNVEEGTIAIDLQLLPGSTAPGIVKNIQIDADIVNSSTDKFSTNFIIRKYNAASQPDPTNRNHLIKNVRVAGNVENAESLLFNAALGTVNPSVWLCATPTGGAGTANWTGENVSQVILRDLHVAGTNTAVAHIIVNGQVCTGAGQNYILDNVTAAGLITKANLNLGNIDLSGTKSANRTKVSTDSLVYNGVVSGSTGGTYGAGVTATGTYSIIDGRVMYQGKITIANPASLTAGNMRVSLPAFTSADALVSLGSFFGYSANTGIILAGSCYANASDNQMLFAVQGLANFLTNLSYTWLANDYIYFQIEYQAL